MCSIPLIAAFTSFYTLLFMLCFAILPHTHTRAGYQISLLTQPDSVDDLKELVKNMLPGSEIVGENAGNLTVGLPRSATAHIPNFLRALNSSPIHPEWSVSNSSLEEVFLRLAVQAQGVTEDTEPAAVVDNSESASRGICKLCQARPTEAVTLYTSKGVSIVAEDLICGECAVLEPEAAERLRNPETTAEAVYVARAVCTCVHCDLLFPVLCSTFVLDCTHVT